MEQRFFKFESFFPALRVSPGGPGLSQLFGLLHSHEKRPEKLVEIGCDLIDQKGIDLGLQRDTKSNSDALKLKERANGHYFALEFSTSLELFNRAIRYTPSDSDLLPLLYGNRSAVFFKTRMYEKSLEDIDRALSLAFPPDRRPRLEMRRAKCLQLLQDSENWAQKFYESDIKLSLPAKEGNPYIAQCLEIVDDWNVGLTFKTTSALAPGDVVLLDKQLIHFNWPHASGIRCDCCGKVNVLSLIPCDDCSTAMYCSVECRREAFDKFHKYECQILSGLVGSVHFRTVMAARLSLLALHLFPNHLRKWLQRIDNDPKSVFEQQFTGDAKKDEKALWKVAYAVRDEHDYRPPWIQRGEAIECALVFKLLMKNSSRFAERMMTIQDQRIFKKLLIHFTQNLHAGLDLSPLPANWELDIDDSVEGVSFYPFLCLLRHSCVPNTARVRAGRDRFHQMVFASQPIQASNLLSFAVCEEAEFAEEKLANRRKFLIDWHGFICACPGCMYDYPTRYQLRLMKASTVKGRLGELVKELNGPDKFQVACDNIGGLQSQLEWFPDSCCPEADDLDVQMSFCCCMESLYSNTDLFIT